MLSESKLVFFGKCHNSSGGHREHEGVAKPRLLTQQLAWSVPRPEWPPRTEECFKDTDRKGALWDNAGAAHRWLGKWPLTFTFFSCCCTSCYENGVPCFNSSVTHQKTSPTTFRVSSLTYNHTNSINFWWVEGSDFLCDFSPLFHFHSGKIAHAGDKLLSQT